MINHLVSLTNGLAVGSISSLKATRYTIGPVAILPDGTIERQPSFTTTDQASLEFWEAVERAFPNFLSKQQPKEDQKEPS